MSSDKPASGMQGLPLFYRQPEVLEARRHGSLVVQAEMSFGFARATNAIPVTVEEFFEMALHYPIVFARGDLAAPVAAVGLGSDVNLFVDVKGGWAADHPVPAYVRRYPFIFFEQAGSDALPLCIDRAAPMVGEAGRLAGLPLFADGKPTEAAKRALQFCELYQRQVLHTRAFVRAIRDAGLLVERQINISSGAIRHTMGGFCIIDEERYRQLPDATVLDFQRNGYLAALHAQMLSQRHWAALARRYDRAAAPAGRAH
ncbi:SapC family protein [Zavarzinia compransoris]|uniref:SapC family protein n=1 Tax=Zavarzinia compransoris TaxID=1264899 RepID=A0A317E0E0_9PROT|nr:SapC family protein [Zavarzinia compransoris]PWR19570.1 hypothetical protein DKG75_13920 [Zavarzinia compransoris]TDP40449.1 SapC protein [Zavarzinia compransoris]